MRNNSLRNETLKEKITKDFPEIYSDCFDYNFSIGEGWYKIVYDLTEAINNINKNVKVLQVKEKFGELRFYISIPNEEAVNEIYVLIRKAMGESSKTCEFCGTKKNITTEGKFWIKTLCNKCREERGE